MSEPFHFMNRDDLIRILVATLFGCGVLVYALYAFLPGVR